MAEVVKLLKPDSGGHMARIFGAYAWRAEGLEILGMPSLPALVRDITQFCTSAPPELSEDDLFLVRGTLLGWQPGALPAGCSGAVEAAARGGQGSARLCLPRRPCASTSRLR